MALHCFFIFSSLWSSSLFLYFSQVCGVLTDPTNGQVNTSAGTAFGNEALYQCDPGYVLSGPSSRQCKTDGSWTGSEPVCNAVGMYRFNCYFSQYLGAVIWQGKCTIIGKPRFIN